MTGVAISAADIEFGNKDGITGAVKFDLGAGEGVTYEFDFARGPHIALIAELQRAVDLYPRRLLRQELQDQLGITLNR